MNRGGLLLLAMMVGVLGAHATDRIELTEVDVIHDRVDTINQSYEEGRDWYLIFGHYPRQRLIALDRQTLEYREVPGVASLRGSYRGKVIVNPSDYSGLYLFDTESETLEPCPFLLDPWPNSLIVHYQRGIFYGARGDMDGA